MNNTSPDESITVFDLNGALSREYLLFRGYCCGKGCRNCPYDKPSSLTGIDAPPLNENDHKEEAK